MSLFLFDSKLAVFASVTFSDLLLEFFEDQAPKSYEGMLDPPKDCSRPPNLLLPAAVHIRCHDLE